MPKIFLYLQILEITWLPQNTRDHLVEHIDLPSTDQANHRTLQVHDLRPYCREQFSEIDSDPRPVVWVKSDIQNWIAEQVSAARG